MSRGRAISAVLSLLAVAACGPSPTVTPPADAPSEAPLPLPRAESAPPPSPSARPFTLEATWASASCGPRAYRRSIRLDGKGRFTALDEISPCPPNAACVWSGIVERVGTYATSGATLTLTVDPTRPGSTAGAPLPATFSLTPGPTEILADGTRCVYQRENDAL